MKKRGDWIWWRSANDKLANDNLNKEIKDLEQEISDLQAKLKSKKKRIKNNKLEDLQIKNDQLKEQNSFLSEIIDNGENGYGDNMSTLIHLIKRMTKKYCDEDEIESFKIEMKENAIPEDMIEEFFT